MELFKDKEEMARIEKAILEEEKIRNIEPQEEELAEILIDKFSDKLDLARQFIKILPLYYDESAIWWLWDYSRSCWKMIDEIEILNWINKKSSANIINSKERSEILNALKQVARKNKPEEAGKLWIQFSNEVIDLQTGLRFKATSKYFITNPIPWKLGKRDETPKFDKLFEEWVGKDWKVTLYEIIAYCILPDYPIERIFCLIGSGSNGKSCFLSILRKFIGNRNVTSTDLGLLLKSRFEAARLFKKLVCQMGETNFEEMSNTQLIKRLVSGKDVVPMEMKNKNPFDTINYAKLIVATNNLPPTEDKSEGWYRKWLIVDFPNKFSEEKDILSDITDEEFENLAIKSVGILMDLLKRRGFTNDGSVEIRMKRYEEKSNPLNNFLQEFTTECSEGFIFKFEFEKRLNEWCKERGHRQISEVAIGKSMRDKKIEQGYKEADWTNYGRIRAWLGISWKSVQDVQDFSRFQLGSSHRDTSYIPPAQPAQPAQIKEIKI